MEPHEIGFTPRKPVPWLGPVLLAATGARVALAEEFGAYLDKRELQNAFEKKLHNHADGEEFWFDYVADLGDGFNATYSVAYLLAQTDLTVGDLRLPRGEVLVMGGDQVYPTASGVEYENRFKGPYRSALPLCPVGTKEPVLYALPGNHDWYDGLTAFLRIFARREGSHVGGWATAQTRSYFALKLPHRWWLLAVDAQPGAYVDDPQLAYFHEVADQFRPGDRVIVCTPYPAWIDAAEVPAEYDTTDYFLRKVIAPTGAEVALMLTGDLHHYNRYASERRQLITAGGGGAYLYATHELPKKLTVPPRESIQRTASRSEEFALQKTYPSRMRSRTLGSGIFFRLPWRNPGFLGLLGVLQVLLLLALDNAQHSYVTIPVFLMVALTFALTFFFATGLVAGRRRTRHYVFGVLHWVAQVGVAIGGLFVWRLVPFGDWRWPMPVVMAALTYGPVFALISAEVMSLYLVVASRFRVNLNELFSSQGIQGYKSFLRLHIARDGSLTIYPIGVDSVSRRWRANPNAPAHTPWIEPRRPLKAELIEPPFQV